MDLDAGKSRARRKFWEMDFPRSQFLPGGMGMLSSTSVTLMSDGSQRCGSPGYGHSPGVDSMTVMGFPG